jgi:hypothetical protein
MQLSLCIRPGIFYIHPKLSMVAVYYQIKRSRKDVISLHNGAQWASEVLKCCR